MTSAKNDERIRLNRFLNRISQLGYGMPSSIMDSERPDFALGFGSRIVGLEFTLAVEGEYVRAQKLEPSESIIITNLKDREPRRSNQELAEEIFSIDGPCRSLDDVMKDWQQKIERSLQTKRAKLNQPGFQLFDENWLLIYDFPFLANDAFARTHAGPLLADLFSKPRKAARDFDTVFIYSDRYLFRGSGNKLTLNYEGS